MSSVFVALPHLLIDRPILRTRPSLTHLLLGPKGLNHPPLPFQLRSPRIRITRHLTRFSLFDWSILALLRLKDISSLTPKQMEIRLNSWRLPSKIWSLGISRSSIRMFNGYQAYFIENSRNSLRIGTRTSSAQCTTSSSKSICTKRTRLIGTTGDWILLDQLVILISRSFFDGKRGLLYIQRFSEFKHGDKIVNPCNIWSHSISLKQTHRVTMT